MRVCLGGTFDLLHAGHEALLAKAFAIGDKEVIIGITSDAMAKRTRGTVNPLERRSPQRRKTGGRLHLITTPAGGRSKRLSQAGLP